MRSRTLPLVPCLLWLCSAGSGAQPLTDPKSLLSPVRAEFVPPHPKDVSALDDLSYPAWSPDGRFIASVSYQSGPANVWLTDVTTKKSRPAAAVSDGPQLWPRWSPDARQILYLADKGGDEMYDIYLIDLGTGRIRNLTQTPGHAETCAGWSPDGREIVFSSRAKESSSGEIAVIDIASRKLRFLTSGGSNERTRVSPLWARSGDYIYFRDRAWSNLDTSIMRVSSSGASAPENLTPHEGETHYRLMDVSRDGHYVLFSSDEGTGWMNVAVLDTHTQKRQWITNERAHHIPASFSPDGKRIVFTRDEPLSTHIFIHDIGSGMTQQLTRGEGMHELSTPFPVATDSLAASSFSPDGKRLVYWYGGSRPGDYVAITTKGGAEEVLVNTLPAKMAHSFVSPVAVTFPSNDGNFQIPALVWIPPNLKRDRSHPAVVEIHGGPTQQTRAYLNTYIQVLAARGYIVISPNYRGSINYYRNFQRANHGDPGGAELSDVDAAADWLIATGYVDPKKVAAYGASYGGYLTLMALASKPDRWAVGVALYPMADLRMTYETAAPWMRAYDRGLHGDPVRDAALWRDRSPLTHANRIRAPVLMNAGANDPRTPLGQIKEMERAIRANGGLVELHVSGDSGHGPADTQAYVDENTMVLDFLDRHLRVGGPQPLSPAQ